MAGMRLLGLADKFVDRIRSDTRDASAAVSTFSCAALRRPRSTLVRMEPSAKPGGSGEEAGRGSIAGPPRHPNWRAHRLDNPGGGEAIDERRPWPHWSSSRRT